MWARHVWYNFKGVVSWVSVIWRLFCIEKCIWELGSCPLSGVKKRPLLGGCLSITTTVISIRNTECVRCRKVVRFSEGPLSEVRLYTYCVATIHSIHNHTNLCVCVLCVSTSACVQCSDKNCSSPMTIETEGQSKSHLV